MPLATAPAGTFARLVDFIASGSSTGFAALASSLASATTTKWLCLTSLRHRFPSNLVQVDKTAVGSGTAGIVSGEPGQLQCFVISSPMQSTACCR